MLQIRNTHPTLANRARNASTAEYPFIWKGLVGAWGASIDPAAHDLSGYGHNGTVTSTIETHAGQGGKSWNFDNVVDEKIDCGAHAALQAQATPLTVSAWIKCHGDYTTTQSFLTCAFGGSLVNWALEFGRTANKFTWLNNNNAIHLTSAISLSDDDWHHVLMSRSGVTSAWVLNFYFDGKFDKTASTSGNSDVTAGSLYIGCWRNGVSTINEADMSIDGVMVHNRAFIASEAKQLYEATKNDRTAWARRRSIPIPYAPAAAPAGGNPWNYYAQQGAA